MLACQGRTEILISILVSVLLALFVSHRHLFPAFFSAAPVHALLILPQSTLFLVSVVCACGWCSCRTRVSTHPQGGVA